MIDTNNAQWDLSKEEQYAIKWFDNNGFDVTIEKQYLSKTKFIVSKDGVTDGFEIQNLPNIKIKDIMIQYGKSFDMLYKLKKLNGNY